jgi:predicted ATPase
MLTRVFIDNFRCFQNFEFKPGSRQLILGGNGTGKSSFMDALLLLRRFAAKGDITASDEIEGQRTQGQSKQAQSFRVTAVIAGSEFVYELQLRRGAVSLERLTVDGLSQYSFADGRVELQDGLIPVSPTHTALSAVNWAADSSPYQFRGWLSDLLAFRINPFAMESSAREGDADLRPDARNLASWYWRLDKAGIHEALEDLRSALDGFHSLGVSSPDSGSQTRILEAQFQTGTFALTQLSEGQRCLIALYLILHEFVRRGRTVIIDEPENFISLRELQPWLMAVDDAILDGAGQVLLISHHPEFINQWAPDFGVQFARREDGSPSVQTFRGDPASELTTAELVARGWNVA